MSWLIGKFKGGIKSFLKTIVLSVDKAFNKISRQFEKGFIKVLRVNVRGGKSIRYIYLFGTRISPKSSKKIATPSWVDANRPIIYFKVNRMSDYASLCVQQWVDIAVEMNSDFYFICDNKLLEYHLLSNVIFPCEDVKFITSDRRHLKNIAKTVASLSWVNAACAHLTPFYHIKKLNRRTFWAIDADDTTFCLANQKSAKILENVQQMVESSSISAMSLDMWRSRTRGRHWSWGIVYVNDNVDYCNIFSENKDLSWITVGEYPYRLGNGDTNFDWYFTYLKNHKGISLDTFYVENAFFIHWGNFLKFPQMVASVSFWNDGKIIYPIYKYIHCNDRESSLDIASDCIKIDMGITRKEGLDFFNQRIRMK